VEIVWLYLSQRWKKVEIFLAPPFSKVEKGRNSLAPPFSKVEWKKN